MRNLTLAIAVAGVLASAAANAENVDLYVSGASAQRTFWKADMATSICGANAQTTYTAAASSGAAPDDQAYRCTAGIATTGIAIGDQVTLHYSAELGSVWGIAPFLNSFGGSGYPTARLFVNPDSANCVSGTCTVTSYDATTETFVGGDALVSHVPDVGATDVDPVNWAFPDNYDVVTYPVLNAVPNSTVVNAFQSSANSKVVNGQVFEVITNNASPIAGRGNISRASLTAILTGQYATWGQVPEVGGGNATAITLCRRDHGSGTEVSASVFFTGTECGVLGSSPIASTAAPASLTSVIENTTGGKLATCVINNAGAIGFKSVGANTSTTGTYTILNVDGVEANAHNAAAGSYGFAFETWAYDNTGASGATTKAANFGKLLISNARKATSLTSQIEANIAKSANGQWVATNKNTDRKSNYAVPGGGFGNTKSVANAEVVATKAVTALGYRSGSACRVLINSNAL
jgi:hypothetical protein